MPHGISGLRARRLAKDIDRFFTDVFRRINSLSGSQLEAERAKYEGLSFMGSTDLQAYLLGRVNDSTVAFGGTARIPDQQSVAEAAEAFGRAMGKQELLDLAAAVRRRGL